MEFLRGKLTVRGLERSDGWRVPNTGVGVGGMGLLALILNERESHHRDYT